MNDNDVKTAVARFLKNINVTAQREIEKALRRALSEGKLHGSDPLAAAITLSSDKVGLNVTIHSRIEL
jgi:hypothetical protein